MDPDVNTATDTRTGQTFTTDILTSTAFPLYVVGPATHRALHTLLATLPRSSPFHTLTPTLHGSHTGSGATLAPYVLAHYNALHASTRYTFQDAPRLPFIPLLGMGSENYSRRRLESDDWRLRKRPLVFLVGEVRRDVIPRTLMDRSLAEGRVEVDEREVYSTVVRRGFRAELEKVLRTLTLTLTRGESESESGNGNGNEGVKRMNVIVIVVFSPQGSGDMLRAIGYADDEGRVTEEAKRRWDGPVTGTRYVVATIGPTTRDHLQDTFGFEPDVCAKKPSPEGVRDGVETFLQAKGLV